MPDVTPESAEHASPIVDQWTARSMRPIFALIYLPVVFAVLIALAFFVFNSIAGVTSLVMSGIGAVVALLPSLLTRVEYRLSESGLEKRPVRRQNPAPFRELFRFPELEHIVPRKHGFMYYKKMDSTTALRDFYRRHISDEYSGEVHLENEDRERILTHLAERGVAGSQSSW